MTDVFGAYDPYEMWATARRECPVEKVGVTDSGRPMFWIVRWDDVEHVLRDNDTFSSSVNAETVGPMMGKFMLAMDGQEHRTYRDLVARAFRASALDRWGSQLIEPAVHGLLDRIAPRGKAELVADLTHAYPVQIIAAILGVPVEDYGQFQEWAEGINLGPTDAKRSMAASRAMEEYLAPIITDRRAQAQDDLISDIVHAEIEGQQLDDDHVYGFLKLLLPAGAETTYRMLGNCLLALLTHTEVLDKVRDDRALLAAVIEETLRWETSVTMVNRTPVREVEVGGCPIPAGASLLVSTGSANRDENRYEDPEAWDITRPPKHHMAFGTGRHQCLGMHLARLELRIALNAVLDRLPNLRLDPGEPTPAVDGIPFRSPPRLPVLFDPVGA
jgi:cytochrome P450